MAQRAPVSFQVDSFDWARRTSWSVLVTGRAYAATHWESDHLRLEPWAEGDRPHSLRIRIEEITGGVIRWVEDPITEQRGYL